MLGTERGLFEKGRFQRQQAFQVLKLAKIGRQHSLYVRH